VQDYAGGDPGDGPEVEEGESVNFEDQAPDGRSFVEMKPLPPGMTFSDFLKEQSEPMTAEEAELKREQTRRSAIGPDYYPDAPDDPAMTPPPLDDDGNVVTDGK
jgi:hypothetical protein